MIDILFRIIVLPIFLLLHLIWALRFTIYKTYLFLRYGGEVISYYEHRKTIFDVYQKLETIFPDKKQQTD